MRSPCGPPRGADRGRTSREPALVPAAETQTSALCQAASPSAPSFRHMGMASSHASTISFLKDPALPFRTASRGLCPPDLQTDGQLSPEPGKVQMPLETFLNTSFRATSTRVQLTNSATTTRCASCPEHESQQSPAQVTGLRSLAGPLCCRLVQPLTLWPPQLQKQGAAPLRLRPCTTFLPSASA